MPTAAVKIPLPAPELAAASFAPEVVRDDAERRITEGLQRLDDQLAALDQSQLDQSPATNGVTAAIAIPADGDYTVSVTSDGISETVTITVTGTNVPVVSASTSQEVLNWAQVQAMRIWQDRVARAWTTTGTSTTSIRLGPSWHISTGTNAGTTGWYDIDDGCTAAANAVWTTNAWQETKHAAYRSAAAAWVKRTPEQIAEEAAQAELRRQAAIVEAAKVKVFTDTAKARARRLLVSMLNPDQRKELEEKNHFHLTVHSRDGAMKVYRIEHGYAGNVKLLGHDGQPVKRYCIHADSRLPYEDQMLAQKLLLEANEAEFLRIANMTQLRAA